MTTEPRFTTQVQPWPLRSVRALLVRRPWCLRPLLVGKWPCRPWACGHRVHLRPLSLTPRSPRARAALGRRSALRGFTFSLTLWSPPGEKGYVRWVTAQPGAILLPQLSVNQHRSPLSAAIPGAGLSTQPPHLQGSARACRRIQVCWPFPRHALRPLPSTG